MIDWSLIAKMWGGFGVTILVLIILSLVAWIIGLVIQKTTKPTAVSKEDSSKG